jgi:hypothetical protein
VTTAEFDLRLAGHLERLAATLRASASGAPPASPVGPAPVVPPASAAKAPVHVPATAVGRTNAWKQVADLPGLSYKWPNEPTEDYATFPVFETADARGAVRIGIGHADRAAADRNPRKRPYLVTFEIVGQKMGRPLVVFSATDDHTATGDFVGVIKGKGPGGRQMFNPGEPLPPAYAGLQIVVFRDKVSGPYSFNKLAVLAAGGDVDSILDHALIQLRIRFS